MGDLFAWQLPKATVTVLVVIVCHWCVLFKVSVTKLLEEWASGIHVFHPSYTTPTLTSLPPPSYSSHISLSSHTTPCISLLHPTAPFLLHTSYTSTPHSQHCFPYFITNTLPLLLIPSPLSSLYSSCLHSLKFPIKCTYRLASSTEL